MTSLRPGHSVRVLAVVAVLVLLPAPSAGAGRWFSSDPPINHTALTTLQSGSVIQCGLRCLVEPLCVGLRVSDPDPGLDPSLDPGFTCTPVTCPPDWSVFSGGCYRVFPAVLSWPDAELACNSAGTGSHLVSISSAAENDFISTLARQAGGVYFHIGMFWPLGAPADGARWTDGSPVTYTAWYSGQPNENHNGLFIATNLAAELREWNDMSPTTLHGYICEHRLQGTG
ncbi:snaclec alboaggregin-A subunit beta'-like [Amphibalanus amphitrite]|uniref:snaclec alboaggregin-A subunit beta'-like n=1 Tax=Amphibalanus amphitrite TaxID=1232801 RepID=UPI001C90B95F|nr:snaclec alboaggregin-A subunit beta'-like [Amphibalanus amphitrite]